MIEKNLGQDQSHRESIDTHRAVSPNLAVLIPIVYGIAETFGRKCEVVLHDFQQPESSIVAIAGNVTNRHVGGSVTQIGLSIIAQGDAAQDQFNYVTHAPNGRVLKSSTIVLRDRDGDVIGALCINLDVTELRLLASMAQELVGPPLQTPEPVTFVDDIGQVLQAVIEKEIAVLGNSIDRLTKQERLTILRSLDRRGIFALRRAASQVAEYLGVSRATVYTYLEEIRGTEKK